ncbi:tripartite tricarboxylate transporter TctB family protein [Pseudopelagicola sp. nBUS_19]|uniref:tripartite tricarboxylate transporter TctB family protein n=1 Tax=unclassified Pseudopelagicola TaxID=2649563 RepID=UPI003EBAC6BB
MNAPVSNSQGQLGSLLTSAFFVFAGVLTLYDTTGYTDRDSQVFPQTVAILLIITAGISFITRFLRPLGEDGFGAGVWWRRCLLIATMLLACFVMPYVGFLPAGVVAFVGGLIAAMHDKWTKSTVFLYLGAGALIMVAFFGLFKFVLLVPLP